MVFLIGSFLIVAVLYGLEFYFSRATRVFGAIFWVFVFQAGVLVGGEIILNNQMGQSLPDWMKAMGKAVGAFALLTIGFTPIAAVLAALLVGAMAATSIWKKQNSN